MRRRPPSSRTGCGSASAPGRRCATPSRRWAPRGYDLTCVATSTATEELAARVGLRLVVADEALHLDVTIDGADEVDAGLNLTKGGGGALHPREGRRRHGRPVRGRRRPIEGGPPPGPVRHADRGPRVRPRRRDRGAAGARRRDGRPARRPQRQRRRPPRRPVRIDRRPGRPRRPAVRPSPASSTTASSWPTSCRPSSSPTPTARSRSSATRSTTEPGAFSENGDEDPPLTMIGGWPIIGIHDLVAGAVEAVFPDHPFSDGCSEPAPALSSRCYHVAHDDHRGPRTSAARQPLARTGRGRRVLRGDEPRCPRRPPRAHRRRRVGPRSSRPGGQGDEGLREHPEPPRAAASEARACPFLRRSSRRCGVTSVEPAWYVDASALVKLAVAEAETRHSGPTS